MIVPPETPENPLGPQKYRFKRGSRLSEMPPVPPQVPVPPLSSLDGPFQLAEYLALKVRADPHNVQGLVDAPADIKRAAERHVWVYEHLRRIPIDVTPLVTQLLHLCNRETCPEMKADEWQYLCVAHGGEGSDRCCAIDYILHTLDSTSQLLNSTKYFPSRLQIPDSSLSHFPSLFRRLSRIFSHAYFHHREAFATSEAETSLYRRFVALCAKYELVGASLLIIPKAGYEGIAAGDDDDFDDMHGDDEDDLESDEEETEDHDEQEDTNEAESRGREKEDSGAQGRSHSLGRHTSFSPNKWSPMQPPTKSKPAPAQESTTQSPPSSLAQRELPEPVIPTTVQGRGTLSRGKGSRGSAANVWAQPVAPVTTETTPIVPEDVPASVIGMARKESVDSVVYVPSTEDSNAEETETASADQAPKRSPSPTKPATLTVDTSPQAKRNEKLTPTPGDRLDTPIPTAATAFTTGDETSAPAPAEKSTLLSSSPTKAQSPAATQSELPPEQSPPKSQLSASRPEVLVSPKTKSELLPSTSPKSELLSVSPKSPGKRGARGGGRGAKPKSPSKPRPKQAQAATEAETKGEDRTTAAHAGKADAGANEADKVAKAKKANKEDNTDKTDK